MYMLLAAINAAGNIFRIKEESFVAKTKTVKKKASISGLVAKLLVAVLGVSLIANLVSGQLQAARMRQELDEVTQQVAQQQEQNQELQQIMESGDEDAYIERVAREKLGYARPGERVFVDITGQ